MYIKIISDSGELPAYETEGAAGMDIKAYLNEPVRIEPWQRQLIPTGLYIEIDPGFEIQLRARSGLAIKHGIALVNGIGTIDCDYRGEVKVALINMSDEAFEINNGDRIAQMVINRIEKASIVRVDKLSDTSRGAGGFGHTVK